MAATLGGLRATGPGGPGEESGPSFSIQRLLNGALYPDGAAFILSYAENESPALSPRGC